MPENPLVSYFGANPGAGAVRISDLVGAMAWRSLGVYSDLYRPLGCERILAIDVSHEPVMIGVAAFRIGADFSERDRAVLNLLRPHITNGYRTVEALTDFGDRLALFEQGFDVAGLGVVELRAGARVRSMTDTAQRLLADYFGRPADPLPEAVLAWLRQASAPATSPLIVEGRAGRLALRLVGSKRQMILLREQRNSINANELAGLGLTRREAEVLVWLAMGKTDAEIAEIIGIARRTVSHTVERVYDKLAVTTRAAATAKALQAAWR